MVSAVEVVPPQSAYELRILGEKVKSEDSEELKNADENEIMDQVRKLAVYAFSTLEQETLGA
jgi:hypothetical protein